MDQLRQALHKALEGGAGALVVAPPSAASPVVPEAAARPKLPDPQESEWIALLRRLGGEVPRDPSMGQLVQRSDALSRALADAGRRREAAALSRAREEFQRDREKRAWALVKERFAALDLPEKTYRAMKQEDADPERLLTRLTSRRAEELRGMGAARLREELLPRKP